MKKIKIEPGCISCGTCAFLAPDVFEVTDISRVKPDVNITEHEKNIEKAMQECPMNIIHYTEQENDKS